MATYRYETITASQALAISDVDTVLFSVGSARNYMVSYGLSAEGQITSLRLDNGDHAVIFGANLVALSQAGRLTFPDASMMRIGGVDPDNFIGGSGDDALFGGPGVDYLEGGLGNDLLQANMGNDSIVGGVGADTIYGGQGDDLIFVDNQDRPGSLPNFAQGNIGADTIYGGAGADTILGGQNDDVIFEVDNARGNAPNYLNGNLGNDSIQTEAGDDILIGEAGNDYLHDRGFTGSNSMDGGAGNDTLEGNAANDTMFGGDGDDIVTGNMGTNYLDGGAGSDRLGDPSGGVGNAWAETIIGGAGNDTIQSGASTFYLEGDDGDDAITSGSNGSPGILDGGAGADTLTDSTFRADTLIGGSGPDQFILGYQSHIVSEAHDIIMDWTPDETLSFSSRETIGPENVHHLIVSTSQYAEISASDYNAALASANALIAGGGIRIVAAKVASGVLIFVDANSTTAGAEEVVELAGRTLADIDYQNFV